MSQKFDKRKKQGKKPQKEEPKKAKKSLLEREAEEPEYDRDEDFF